MKPQASGPKPPQFGHDSIDLRKALLLLGLPLLAVVLLVLVLVASPLLWWIAAGLTAAGVAGTMLLRRSGRARGIARRLPGVGRAGAGLRRVSNGRFARSPLGRAVGRTFGRSPAGSPAGKRAGGVGGRVRAALPSWMGGTRGRRPSARTNTSGGSPARPRAGTRARQAFARMMPGARGRAARAAHAAGKQARGGSRAASAAGGRSGGRPRVGGATGKPSGGRAGTSTSTNRTHGRSAAGARRTGSNLPRGATQAMRAKAGQVGRVLGLVSGALTGSVELTSKDSCTTRVRSTRFLPGREPNLPPHSEPPAEDETTDEPEPEARPAPFATAYFPPKPDVSDVARRAKKRAKQAAKAAADERAHDPPPSPAPSPPSHREKPRETPRITSTNPGGRAMAVSPTKYNDLITNASSRSQGWQAAADAFRRDSSELDEKAKEHDEAARIFKSTGNLAAAEEREDEARKLRDDANTCLTYAAKMQEKANSEASAA